MYLTKDIHPITLCFRLIIGYVIHPDGQLDGVSSSDFELHKLGEDGKSPDEFEFNFKAGENHFSF